MNADGTSPFESLDNWHEGKTKEKKFDKELNRTQKIEKEAEVQPAWLT